MAQHPGQYPQWTCAQIPCVAFPLTCTGQFMAGFMQFLEFSGIWDVTDYLTRQTVGVFTGGLDRLNMQIESLVKGVPYVPPYVPGAGAVRMPGPPTIVSPPAI